MSEPGKSCTLILGNIAIFFVPFFLRYQRGSRSLASNLGGGVISATQGGGSDMINAKDEDSADDMDVPEEIEEVIGEPYDVSVIICTTSS